MATVSKRKIKFVRPKLKLFRANDPVRSVFMWGINYSISSLNHVNAPIMLDEDHYNSHMKVKVNNQYFNK